MFSYGEAGLCNWELISVRKPEEESNGGRQLEDSF